MTEHSRPPRDNIVRMVPKGIEMREAEDPGGMPTLNGHFLRFGEWTRIDSAYEGTFMERIERGSAKKTITENRDGMKVTFNHGHDPSYGDKVLGPIKTLEEDSQGVRYEVPLLDTSYNRDLVPGLEAGLYGASFRFRVMREDIREKPERSTYNPDGIPERTIKEMQIYEFGPVTFPAYAGATAAVRSLTDEFMFDQFAAHPDKLRELMSTRAEVPEAPSEVVAGEVATTTEERREEGTPEPQARTEEESTDMLDPNKSLTELEARQKVIESRQQEIDADAGVAPLSELQQKEWDDLKSEKRTNAEAISAKQERMAELHAVKIDDPKTTERAWGSQPTSRGPQGDEIFDLSTVRGAFDNPEYARQEMRDRAMKAVEDARFPDLGHRASKEDMQSRVSYLLDNCDTEDGALARRILLTGHPQYESAFWKSLTSRQLSAQENAVMQRALGVATTGYAMPFALDPTVALTSNGVVNPLRDIARVVTITGQTWSGVNSAGITASFDAEAVEVSDDTPTLTQPTTTVLKAAAFVPYSIESEGWSDLRSELTLEFQDAKDTLEATNFAVGTGSPLPQGVMVGATSLATTAGSAVIALSDIDTLADALPPRYQANAVLLANRKFYSKVRQLGRATGVTEEWAPERQGVPSTLLGYPKYELSTLSSAITTVAALVAVIGDFRRFVIVDRVGMSVEYIPHLFHTSNNRPSGQRGLYCYWMTTSLVRDANAFRVLKIGT